MQTFGITCYNDVFHLSTKIETKMIPTPDMLFTLTVENTVVTIFPLNDRLSVVFQSSIALIYFGKPFFSGPLSPLCGGTEWVETVIHAQQILCEPITILLPSGDPSNSDVKV